MPPALDKRIHRKAAHRSKVIEPSANLRYQPQQVTIRARN
jgi:hypothetical protein